MGGGSSDPNSTYTNVGKYSALDALYFLFFSMLSGAFFLFVKRRGYDYLPVPALQFLWGLSIGLIHEGTKVGQDPYYYEGGLGDLSEGIHVWTFVDPHLLAAVFLPALIFSDAMQVDFHLFRRIFSQAFLLATVGVAMQMCAMAMLAYYFLASTGILWHMPLCFAFGAALSATDPVAVVAMLESVQAPAKLTTLMSGESHLSDLVALVSFNIFLATSVDEQSVNTDKLVQYVMSMIFGGPALGLLFGLLALYAIRINSAPNNNEDTQIQIAITIVCAYFSFIVSENNVNGNGVLATVSSALVISAYAWPSFSKPEAIEQVWKTIEFSASSIVFCFGGLAFGMTAFEYYGTEYVPADLYGTCLFLWLMLYAVRAGVIIVLFPVLRKLGYGIRWNEALALTWGSLRGAVAIVLGLVVFETDTLNLRVDVAERSPKRDSVQFFFLVAGIVFLSVVVNSSTTPILMKVFKVLSKSDVQKLLLRGLKLRIHQRAEEKFKEIVSTDDEFKTVRREKLVEVITAFDSERAEKYLQPHLVQHQLWARVLIRMGWKNANPVRETVKVEDMVCDVETLEVVRELFLDIVKAGYWDMIKDGTLPKNSVATRKLLQSVDIAKDEVEFAICDLDLLNLKMVDDGAAPASWHERAFACIDRCLPDWVKIDDYVSERVHELIQQGNIYAATCFVRSHLAAQQKLAKYVGEDASADSPEEQVVIMESQREVARALGYLKLCSETESHIVDMVTTKKVGSRVLEDQRNQIYELFAQGVLDERGEAHLLRQVEDQLFKLQSLSLRKFEARKSVAEYGDSRRLVLTTTHSNSSSLVQPQV